MLFVNQNISYAQKTSGEKREKIDIEKLVTSKRFNFIAQSALPLSGRSVNLTSAYDLTINGDSLVSDLPYFGRAFIAPLNADDGGIHFTSTNFTYSLTERKKGGWNLLIEPKDSKNVRQLNLTISETGNSSLQVTSDDRQSISYNGYITEGK